MYSQLDLSKMRILSISQLRSYAQIYCLRGGFKNLAQYISCIMLRVGNSSPRGEILQQKKAESTDNKMWLALAYILMVFLLFEVVNPGFEVKSLFSIGQRDIVASPSAEVEVNASYVFTIPKKLWITDTADASYLSGLCTANNKRVANGSGFESVFVNRDNFRPFISAAAVQKVEAFIAMIEGKIWGKQYSQTQAIINNFILLNILNENGGIMTDGKCALVEGFGWVNDIVRNNFANRANRGIRPRIVGFYSMNHTLDKVKEDIRPFAGMKEVDRYTAAFPSLEPYFIAAEKNTPFIAELIAAIVELLRTPQDFKRHHFHLQRLRGDDIFTEYFHIAVQIVLQNKQRQIDAANKDSFRHFAMDHYGLSLINCYYAPYKQEYLWEQFYERYFLLLSKYVSEEYDANYGPIRYLFRPTNFETFNRLLENVRDGKREKIWDRSWVQKLFFPNGGVSFLKENKEKPFINETNEQWLNLPKIIWLFYDTGVVHAPIITQVCVESLKRVGKQSGFEVRQVNISNAHLYLKKQTLEKINYTITNAKLQTYTPSLSDLYRIALILENGGIYFDTTYVAVQNFDWIINIGRHPSQYIFNRYGHLPNILLLWYGLNASPFDWEVDEKHNTKSMWHLPYQSNFIAAQKGNQLLKDWFQFFTSYYLKPYQEVAQFFRSVCKISQTQWISESFHYLFVMDSIKCVVGMKQISLMKEGKGEYVSASDYYKVWSMNGFLGQQKLRDSTNYEDPWTGDQRFIYRYPQEYAEEALGKVNHLFKIYSKEGRFFIKFIIQHRDGNFTGETHPDSFFMRYMWKEDYKIVSIDNQFRLAIKS